MHIDFLQAAQHESAIDLLHDIGTHYNGAHAATREVVKAHFLSQLLAADSAVRIVVAMRDDGMVTGLIAITIFHSFVNPVAGESGQLFIKELYVHSNARRTGVGEALMQWAARYALNNGCARMDWHVMAYNDKARNFYESLGAAHVVERLHYRLDGEDLARLGSLTNLNKGDEST